MTVNQVRNLFILLVIACIVGLAALSIDSVRKVSAERTPPVTKAVADGKAVWQANNCNDCHTILGIGGYFAPDLTKVSEQKDAAWLESFLVDPQKTKPGTTMPNLALTGVQADNLVAFFQWVDRIDTNNWPPKPLVSANPAGAGTVADGQLLVQQKGCTGCHKINGQGASGPGPDLSHVGSRLSKDQIEQQLENPKEVNPSAIMPAIAMSDSERETIADYLAGLK